MNPEDFILFAKKLRDLGATSVSAEGFTATFGPVLVPVAPKTDVQRWTPTMPTKSREEMAKEQRAAERARELGLPRQGV